MKWERLVKMISYIWFSSLKKFSIEVVYVRLHKVVACARGGLREEIMRSMSRRMRGRDGWKKERREVRKQGARGSCGGKRVPCGRYGREMKCLWGTYRDTRGSCTVCDTVGEAILWWDRGLQGEGWGFEWWTLILAPWLIVAILKKHFNPIY